MISNSITVKLNDAIDAPGNEWDDVESCTLMTVELELELLWLEVCVYVYGGGCWRLRLLTHSLAAVAAWLICRHSTHYIQKQAYIIHLAQIAQQTINPWEVHDRAGWLARLTMISISLINRIQSSSLHMFKSRKCILLFSHIKILPPIHPSSSSLCHSSLPTHCRW